MKRTFFSFLFILLFLTSFSLTASAAIDLNGSISPVEVEDSNMEIQCENGNSGCGLYMLATYYKPLPSSSEIYLAFNAELDGEEINLNGPFGFEIYIEDTQVIKIYTNSRTDFDSSLYNVKLSNQIDFSLMKCETLIMFKNHLPKSPKIYVRVIDNDGVPSRMFKINTVIPEETTSSVEKTTKPKESEKTTRKSSSTKSTLPTFDFDFSFPDYKTTRKTTEVTSQNSNITSSESSTTLNNNIYCTDSSIQSTKQKRSDTEKPLLSPSTDSSASKNSDSKTLAQNSNGSNETAVQQYELSTKTDSNSTDAKDSRNKLILISAVSIASILVVACAIGIKTSGKKH